MSTESLDLVPNTFAFGGFVLIPARQALLLEGEPLRLGSRALEILSALVQRAGEVVTKRELLTLVWPDTVVEECNLKVQIAVLRRILSQGLGLEQYIATVTGRGYRFVAPVRMRRGLDAAAPAAIVARRDNLPPGPTGLIGRADIAERITEELAVARQLSIVGSGGAGKTALAMTLATATAALGRFKDGVWWIDVTTVDDPQALPREIAAAMRLPLSGDGGIGALCHLLRGQETLLVLDGCEAHIEAAAICADALLTSTAGVTLLVTSREPLQIARERVRRLSGLAVPPRGPSVTAAEALEFSAIELFVERVSSSEGGFALTDAEATSVAEICRRLDGLPLAIELAAARVRELGVAGLLGVIHHRFQHMVGRRAGPARHRSLAAALEWSYRLLSSDEAALLRAVSLFDHRFDAHSASVLANLPPHRCAEALRQLSGKCLINVDLRGDTATYRLLETTRRYCAERLTLSGEEHAVRNRRARLLAPALTTFHRA